MNRFVLSFLGVFSILNCFHAQSRLANITVATTFRTHAYDCGFGGDFFTDPDPRYDISAQYLSGGVGSGLVGPPVFQFNEEPCSGYDFSHTILDVQGVCADEVQIRIEWWEEDGVLGGCCGGCDTYNPSGCTNNDENYNLFTPIRP